MFTEKWSMNNHDRSINDCACGAYHIPGVGGGGRKQLLLPRFSAAAQLVEGSQQLFLLWQHQKLPLNRGRQTEENSEQCFSRHVRTVLLHVHLHVMTITHAARLIIKAVFIDRL